MKRFRIRVRGIVQGVGYRPFIYNLAQEHHISGFVGNDSDGVFIEAQSGERSVRSFLKALREQSPPLATVDSVEAREIQPLSVNGFVIRKSERGEQMSTLISPDMAICGDCVSELHDPEDRRYHYPFINCTNCGPRYSIIYTMPYDRPNTSMREFPMCDDCAGEYEDPGNRRFHAQPNACEKCGPWTTLYSNDGELLRERDAALESTRELLLDGKIVAIKGLGGFHLACHALNREAVERLRSRKNREEKPLAVMMKDLDTIRRYVNLTQQEEEILTSPQSPILLAEKRSELNQSVAPGNPKLGVMLPYTPLHHLLFGNQLDCLVMTSGNFSEEPICIRNDGAISYLNAIADFILVHNREILQRVDDSVVTVMNDHPRFIRRSRGYAPGPVGMLFSTEPVLGVGAELKNTICYTRDDQAFPSQHIGDLANTRALDFFHHTREHLADVLEITPELIVHDLHPGYLATDWALNEQSAIPVTGVQHHHAHMAGTMVEHGIDEPAIGLILDGTGYGTDGTIWGGEVLVGDYLEVERFAHIEKVPLPGGDKAIEEPWRMGLSYLRHTFGEAYPDYLPKSWEDYPVDLVASMVGKGVNSPLTSSCGRLFDGISALAGGRTKINYEAQAAIEFEHAITPTERRSLEFGIEETGNHYKIRLSPLIKSVIAKLMDGTGFGELSTLFHRTMTEMWTEVALKAGKRYGIDTVVLSGGVFQNRYLFEHLFQSLESKGFRVLTHTRVPANDGGISLGQVAIGQALLNAGRDKVNYRDK